MSLLITETRVIDLKVNKCLCGGETEHGASNGCGYSGSAYVECKDCGLKMTENNGSVGYDGVTLETLYCKVVVRWNKTMPDAI